MRSIKTLLILLAGAALLAAALPASASEGQYFTVSGTVTDANWNPISGALVTVYDLDYNGIITQNTNEQGHFLIENITVKSNTFHLKVSYTDANGEVHTLPGYYIPAYTAKGDVVVDPAKTNFDFYTLPGSQPRVTPTPVPTATPVPTPLPTATPVPQDSNGLYVIMFIGGFISGASVALLGCIIFLRPRKPAN